MQEASLQWENEIDRDRYRRSLLFSVRDWHIRKISTHFVCAMCCRVKRVVHYESLTRSQTISHSHSYCTLPALLRSWRFCREYVTRPDFQIIHTYIIDYTYLLFVCFAFGLDRLTGRFFELGLMRHSDVRKTGHTQQQKTCVIVCFLCRCDFSDTLLARSLNYVFVCLNYVGWWLCTCGGVHDCWCCRVVVDDAVAAAASGCDVVGIFCVVPSW